MSVGMALDGRLLQHWKREQVARVSEQDALRWRTVYPETDVYAELLARSEYLKQPMPRSPHRRPLAR
jgi:hypothetical protein